VHPYLSYYPSEVLSQARWTQTNLLLP